MDYREQLNKLDNKTLYLNLLFTQTILFVIGVVLYLFFLREKVTIHQLFHSHDFYTSLLFGVIFALVVIIIDVVFMSIFPKDYFDDGGVNERIFRDIHAWQIALLALTVACIEEWLFRGVLQNLIGLYWTSLLFAVIHYRYLKKWLYAIVIISISFGFGFLYDWTGSIWSVIMAHFIIDLCMGLMIRYKWFPFKKQDLFD